MFNVELFSKLLYFNVMSSAIVLLKDIDVPDFQQCINVVCKLGYNCYSIIFDSWDIVLIIK